MNRHLFSLLSRSTSLSVPRQCSQQTRWAVVSHRLVAQPIQSPHHMTSSIRHLSDERFVIKGVHEPEYLDLLKPQIPFYNLINVQIRGHDYAVLENYGRYLHNLANKLGLSVTKYWCAPCTTAKLDTIKHESTVLQATYELDLYERNLQLGKVSGRVLSLLLDVLHRSLPAGVYLSVHEHNEAMHESTRYIPDHQLAEHQEELKQLLSRDDIIDTEAVKK